MTLRVLLLVLVLVGCADPIAERAARDREDARIAVLGDAMFYWQCAHKAVQTAGECRPWSEAFERDRAAFLARYGATAAHH